ncbi:hypothetical protein [Microbacterium sp. UBA6741]|uniref:hypothetical protein n=1 Tax=Microbacterium sp. UBA6741 TaxID=1946952 RepID=UPI0025ED5678|nr:hypothetical protein [Microbacterium sp. UBA6741]
MKTIELSWSDTNGSSRTHVIDPATTKVKAISAAGKALIEAHAEYKAIDRERTASAGDPARLEHEAKVAAREAGKAGQKVDPKKLRKKIREAEERLGEIELDWEAAAANLRGRRHDYLASVEHHAPALAAEATAIAEAAILSLASASEIARKGEANVTGSLSILAALAETVNGGDFIPKAPRARRQGSDEFMMGSAPAPYVGEARDKLTSAIGFATRILDDLKAAAKDEEKRRKLEAEIEAAPDLDDDDEDDDDE